MNISPIKKSDFCLKVNTFDRIKQREALENAYSNFVEPQINQWLEVQVQSMPTVPLMSAGFCCVSGWLLLTVLYCLWTRER